MFHKGKCQVCGKETDVAKCGSVFGPDEKFLYCEECMETGAEPYNELVTYICNSECGPDELTDAFNEIIDASVKAANKTTKQFWKDVKRERAQEE